MTEPKTVLLLGRRVSTADEAERALGLPGVRVLVGSSLDDARAALDRHEIAHVVVGGGLELDVRLAVVRAVFEASPATTVHLKDAVSGPATFVAFARGVLDGLGGYAPLGAG